jgi:DNA transformation protein and related proteins
MSEAFADFARRRLADTVPIHTRRMFGADGVFADSRFLGVVTGEAVFLKVDAGGQAELEARGMEPFHPFGDAQVIRCWRLPDEVVGDPEELTRWVEGALRAAEK